MTLNAFRLVTFVVATVMVSGCSARRADLAHRFVKPGGPAVSFDKPPAMPSAVSLGDYARRVRELQARATTKVSLLPTLESRDPALAAALLALAIHESAENHRAVALAYRAAGINDHAHRHLLRALRIDRCDATAYEELARLWRDWAQPQLALGDVYRGIHCRPSSASLYNTLGTILQALDQPDNARHAFEHALRLEPDATFALNNLCYLAVQQGDGVKAQRTCERTLALEPMMTTAAANLALAHALQGHVERAEAQLLRNQDPAVAQFNLGILRMSMSNYAGATTAFETAARTRPSLVEAAQRATQARLLAAAERERNDVDR